MGIDWITIGVAVGSALLTHLMHRFTNPAVPASSPSSGVPTPPAVSPPAKTGLFGLGGLLHRASAPSSTGHPLIDSLFHAVENTVAQNPQIISALSSVVLSLIGPKGITHVTVGSGASVTAVQASPAPAVPVNDAITQAINQIAAALTAPLPAPALVAPAQPTIAPK